MKQGSVYIASGIGIAKLNPKVFAERESPKWYSFETAKAFYFPYYERHDEKPTVEELKQAGEVDLHFIELITPSKDLKIESSISTLLSMGYTPSSNILTILNLTEPQIIHEGRTLPDDYLNYFSEINAYIGIEGIDIPEKLRDEANLKELKKDVLSKIPLAISTLVGLVDFMNKRPASLKKSAVTILSSAISLWRDLPELLTIPIFFNSGNREALNSAAKLRGVLTSFTPGDIEVFFRGIVAARKLTVLADFIQREKFDKPKISFNFGAAHGNIEHFLKLPEDILINLLNVYPKDFLQQIVDYNGGIEAFCSTKLIPVREVYVEDRDVAGYIVDNNLKDYLTKRLAP